MKWKALMIAAILQAQFPVTGKAARINGKELLEPLCACVRGAGRHSGGVVGSWCPLRVLSSPDQWAAEQGGVRLDAGVCLITAKSGINSEPAA